MKHGLTLQCGPVLHYSINLPIQSTNIQTEPLPLNMEQLPQHIHRYTDIFYSVLYFSPKLDHRGRGVVINHSDEHSAWDEK